MARKKPDNSPGLFSPRCDQCGEILALTPSGYLACPMGHGKLIVNDVEPTKNEEGQQKGWPWYF